MNKVMKLYNLNLSHPKRSILYYYLDGILILISIEARTSVKIERKPLWTYFVLYLGFLKYTVLYKNSELYIYIYDVYTRVSSFMRGRVYLGHLLLAS